jgi:hypothetical protein
MLLLMRFPAGTESRQGAARVAQRYASVLDRRPLRPGSGRHVGLAARAAHRRGRIPSRGEARRGGRHHHPASRCASAAHPADHGGNLGREELDHHLPRAIHDDGAGSPGADRKGFGAEVAREHFHGVSRRNPRSGRHDGYAQVHGRMLRLHRAPGYIAATRFGPCFFFLLRKKANGLMQRRN